MIRLHNISVDLRSKKTTRTISLGDMVIGAGAIGALFGENGTGKTTILRIAAGSIVPKSGTVQVERPLIAFTDIERQVHYRLTVLENHQFFQALYGLESVARARTTAVLEEAGLGAMVDKKAGSLSKGEKARLVFSVIDAHQCKSFIVDEPTNGLDANGRDYICAVITRKLAAGAAGLISTHDVGFIEAIGALTFKTDAAPELDLHA